MVFMNLFAGRRWRQREDFWTKWGKEEWDEIQNIASTHTHYHVPYRQLVRSGYEHRSKQLLKI